MNLMEDQQAPQSAEGEAKVITLCGSTRFEAEFAEVNQRLTMEGCVVISLGMFSLPDLPDYDWTADSSDLKGRLGGVHFQKIRMADEVYIVDPGGYVGESTRREIAYAESLGKPVRYLSRERLAERETAPKSESDRAVRSSAMRVRPFAPDRRGLTCRWPSGMCMDVRSARPTCSRNTRSSVGAHTRPTRHCVTSKAMAKPARQSSHRSTHIPNDQLLLGEVAGRVGGRERP